MLDAFNIVWWDKKKKKHNQNCSSNIWNSMITAIHDIHKQESHCVHNYIWLARSRFLAKLHIGQLLWCRMNMPCFLEISSNIWWHLEDLFRKILGLGLGLGPISTMNMFRDVMSNCYFYMISWVSTSSFTGISQQKG